MFFPFMQKFNLRAKIAEKCMRVLDDSAYALWAKNIIEITLSRTDSCSVSEITAFLCFTQNLKMASKNGGKRFLAKMVDDYAYSPWQ